MDPYALARRILDAISHGDLDELAEGIADARGWTGFYPQELRAAVARGFETLDAQL